MHKNILKSSEKYKNVIIAQFQLSCIQNVKLI